MVRGSETVWGRRSGHAARLPPSTSAAVNGGEADLKLAPPPHSPGVAELRPPKWGVERAAWRVELRETGADFRFPLGLSFYPAWSGAAGGMTPKEPPPTSVARYLGGEASAEPSWRHSHGSPGGSPPRLTARRRITVQRGLSPFFDAMISRSETGASPVESYSLFRMYTAHNAAASRAFRLTSRARWSYSHCSPSTKRRGSRRASAGAAASCGRDTR